MTPTDIDKIIEQLPEFMVESFRFTASSIFVELVKPEYKIDMLTESPYLLATIILTQFKEDMESYNRARGKFDSGTGFTNPEDLI